MKMGVCNALLAAVIIGYNIDLSNERCINKDIFLLFG